jgi:hypothetical protein
MLDSLAIPTEDTEAVFYNDTNDLYLQSRLRWYLEQSRFAGAKLYMSRNQAPPEIGASTIRRDRIVAMKNKSRELLDNTKYVIGLEDDTFPVYSNTIVKLIEHIEAKGNENVGFISGIERGRWGYAILGAWQVNNVHEPTHAKTMAYREQGMTSVDAAGWYCYITPTSLYKAAEYHVEGECLGPDVTYGLDVRRRGFKCLVDWSLVCGHKLRTYSLFPGKDCMVVEWEKKDNTWNIIHENLAQTSNNHEGW